MKQIALTEADKQKLIKAQGGGAESVIMFKVMVAIGVLAVTYGFIFQPQAAWPSIATPFVLLFAFGLFVAIRAKRKVKYDLQAGMKECLEGVVEKKRILQGNKVTQYDSDTQQRIAKRIDEEETGKPITRYGVLDAEINSTARSSFSLKTGSEFFNVGIHNYLQIKEGDKVQLEVAPKSREVLNVKIV